MKFLSLVLLLTFGLAEASELCPQLRESISKYVAEAIKGERQYEVERPLVTYMRELIVREQVYEPHFQVFNHTFTDDLYALKPNELWIDLGCGEGQAIIDAYSKLSHFKSAMKNSRYLIENRPISEAQYLFEKLGIYPSTPKTSSTPRYQEWAHEFLKFLNRPNKEKPRAIGVTYEMKRKVPKNDKYEFKTGKLFSEYASSEFKNAKLITDFYGVNSYTKDLNGYLKKVFEILEVDGKIYIKNSHTYVHKKKKLFRKNPDEPQSLANWLAENAKGIKVHDTGALTFMLEKTDEIVEIPTLKLLEFKEGKPPTRTYIEE